MSDGGPLWLSWNQPCWALLITRQQLDQHQLCHTGVGRDSTSSLEAVLYVALLSVLSEEIKAVPGASHFCSVGTGQRLGGKRPKGVSRLWSKGFIPWFSRNWHWNQFTSGSAYLGLTWPLSGMFLSVYLVMVQLGAGPGQHHPLVLDPVGSAE